MKINTISAYVLVYLLARGHWNLMVPVRAEVEGDGGSVAVPAGGDASSTVAEPAANEGSTASPDAGSTTGEPADGAGAPADNAELVAKREAAKRLADNARKTADEAKSAADEMLRAAEALSQAIESANDVAVLDAEMEKLSATVDAKVYEVNVGKSKLDEVAKPPDMMYYDGFPDGWHFKDPGALQDLEDREKKLAENWMYYSGFPNGWHSLSPGAIEQLTEREKKIEDYMLYHDGFPDGWHFGNPLVLREIRRYELKGAIEAKKTQIEICKKLILDLTTQMESIDAEVKKLDEEHNELVQKLLGLDASLIRLYKADADGNPVEMEENTDFEKKKAHGDLRFEFKGVKCTLVKYGDHELWKKGDHSVDEPKLVAFNGNMGVIAVRDNDRAVLYKKETDSDKWKHHNTVMRQTRTGAARTAAHTGSSAAPAGSSTAQTAPAPGPLASGLSASKLELDTSSTGTPETVASLNEADETASVASGGSDANEAEASTTALRGSTGEGTALSGEVSSEGKEGLAGEGSAGTDYSSVFMD